MSGIWVWAISMPLSPPGACRMRYFSMLSWEERRRRFSGLSSTMRTVASGLGELGERGLGFKLTTLFMGVYWFYLDTAVCHSHTGSVSQKFGRKHSGVSGR